MSAQSSSYLDVSKVSEGVLDRIAESIISVIRFGACVTWVHLTDNVSFALLLYEPTEPPISWYIIVTIVLLVIFLGVTTYYSFRKQKSYKIKEIGSESEEFLQAKKNLLMSLLKDLEKQHRANKISDDTHHKLKADFKQQTLETMGKLEKNKIRS